jgi:hypothetical protein
MGMLETLEVIQLIEDIDVEGGEIEMLWTIGIILLVLWLLGLVTAHTFGGVIHVLLVIALVVIVIRLLQGRRV